ncbi:MAG TPA: uracil-DNA glycosylase [Xanthobacteraceae bacterium]|nr:uracil-DNA glycosylase [Xanthobacteraceae bacterium]
MPSTLSNPYDILAFHAEAGVDIALEEAPQNRFEEAAEPAPVVAMPVAAKAPLPAFTPRPQAPAAPISMAAPAAPDEAALEAREMASKAASLDELHEILKRFDGCALKKTAKNLVFADGTPGARVMFVGEAPGADEDREGLPFVGRSGKLLDLMMNAIGLDRTSAYIANIVPWRPPGNRTPTPQETAICLPFIKRQIELANPDFLICLGKPSMQTLLHVAEGIKAGRGKWRDFETGTRTIKAMATFHPAYLLRSPNEKKFAWRDMLALKKALAS